MEKFRTGSVACWIGILAGALLPSCDRDPTARELPPAGAAAGAAATLVESTAGSGIDFVHFNGMSGERYYVETVGPGGALLDHDGDGDLDLLLVQGSPLGGVPAERCVFPPPPGGPSGDRLFRNLLRETGRLRFEDITASAGIIEDDYGMGATVGDVDGDGDPDLLVTNFGRDRLWINEGGVFRDGTERAGLGDPRWTTSAAFFDPDRDGDLDLIVVAYVDFTLENHKPCFSETSAVEYCGPSSYRPLPARFYRNRGDGTFADESARSRIGLQPGAGLGVVVTDLDRDGWIDIYVANDGMPNRLWKNLGDGTFEDTALLGGCAYNRDGRAEASMGVEAEDFDGDGDDDLFLTHLTDETNTFYRNDGRGVFEDATAASGLGVPSRPFTGFGTAAIDLEADGDLDLFVANGAVKTIAALAAAGDPYPLHQRNQLFRNEGGRFREVPPAGEPALALSEVSRGVCAGDLDDDGALDLIVLNNSGPARLHRGRPPAAGAWIGLDVREANGRSPAIGAEVRLRTADGRTHHRRVRVASSYLTANDPRVLFGLGGAAGRDATAEVRIRGGDWERFEGLAPGRYHTLAIGRPSAGGEGR